MKTHAIITAAGQGLRLGSPVPKPLITIKDKAILIYSLEAFEQSSLIEGMVVTAPPEQLSEFQNVVSAAHFKKSVRVVPGGQTRQESVAKGLEALNPNTDFVAVHDAARPLITTAVIDRVIQDCYHSKASIVAVPVKSSIKRMSREANYIDATLDRSILWEAQTPQVFSYELLIQAHRQGVGLQATDDAFLVERFGCKIRMIEGEYRNIKITTPEDLKIAAALLESHV